MLDPTIATPRERVCVCVRPKINRKRGKTKLKFRTFTIRQKRGKIFDPLERQRKKDTISEKYGALSCTRCLASIILPIWFVL